MEDIKEKILKILNEGKYFGYGNDAITGELIILFNKEANNKRYVFECKVCGKPFEDNESLYEHFNDEHNR